MIGSRKRIVLFLYLCKFYALFLYGRCTISKNYKRPSKYGNHKPLLQNMEANAKTKSPCNEAVSSTWYLFNWSMRLNIYILKLWSNRRWDAQRPRSWRRVTWRTEDDKLRFVSSWVIMKRTHTHQTPNGWLLVSYWL